MSYIRNKLFKIQRPGQDENNTIGFIGIMLCVLAASTAGFFFLGRMDEDLALTWLGWFAFFAVGATFSFALGMKVDYNVSGEDEVMIFGVMVGLTVVLMQLIISGVSQVSGNIFVHSTAKDNVLVALLAGVSEELFFRGFIQEAFEKFFPMVGMAAIPSAVIFSLFHYEAVGNNPFALGVLFVGGLILGLVYSMTRNVGVPILAHALNNTIATYAQVSKLVASLWWVAAVPILFAVLAYIILLLRGIKR